MVVKRKLGGTVDESSADKEIRKSNVAVHNFLKIWRPAPSGNGSYGRPSLHPADKIWARLGIFKACCKSIFNFLLCLAKVLHCFSNFDALLTLFSGKYTATRLFYRK